ncbi:LamB/YcsF family protein [Rothia nasimurium]|uniref:LamB/YcsF family protein n=1 Tax=Rothia nasimurium TaxID=85336 RepID=UPI001F32D129|nr:5-oxoprolinase subunit PxpA [Rothia nasimurium]
MTTRVLDLNSDSGESFGSWTMGDDAAMMQIVSSANIACGFHAGDPSVARSTVRAARENGVTVGAHVSYPDLGGFGRRFMDMTATELTDSVIYQAGALQAIARIEGTEVRYCKPHGGLYNAIVHHTVQAQAVAQALHELGDLPILCLPGSEVARAADALGVPVFYEAFADRGYTPEGTLVSRREPGAVIHDPQAVAERVVRMAVDGEVVAVDGSVVPLQAASVCVHGDTPGAVAIAAQVRVALEDAGVQLRAFA